MVSISFSKRDFVWIGLILILISAGFGIAYTSSIPANGHGGENVLVSLDGVEQSLQSAIDDLAGSTSTGGVSCEWKNMTITTTKPGGSICGTGNSIAYITEAEMGENGVMGGCKYITSDGYAHLVYGTLTTHTNDAYYDSNRIVVCESRWYNPTMDSSNNCGVLGTSPESAQYLVCS